MVFNFFLKIKQKYLLYWKNLYFRAFIYSFISFLLLRIFSSAIMLIGIIHPSADPPFSGITTQVFRELSNGNFFIRLFFSPWYRWDTAHYLVIADFGYDYDLINTIWPPLYPFLIKVVGLIFQPSIVAALVVSNLFFLSGLYLLYLYVSELFTERVAKNTLFFIIIFPTSFFFVAGYTESIFLTFSIGVFLLLRKKKWLWTGILSALATLTRIQGLLLVIPIVIEISKEFYENRDAKVYFTHLISCSYAPFAYGLYSFYVRFGLNTNWPWSVLSSNWEQHFGLPWEGIIGSIHVFLFKSIYHDNPGPIYLFNAIFALLAIYLLIRVRKAAPLSLFIYSWAMMILFLGKIDINNALVSTIRYLLIIFPVFISQALFIKKKMKIIYTIFSIGLMILFLVVFYWWLWVG